MAQPDQNADDERRALVRGADGTLYLISKRKPPIKLGNDESRIIQDLIREVEQKLSDQLIPVIGSGSNHSIPELFDD